MQIELKNLSYKYNVKSKSKPELSEINLEIPKTGEFIFILGKTGSGKSTLIQHFNMLLKPTSGSINVLDINNRKNFKIKDIRKSVGLVFQFSEYQLFEESVIKDVMFGPINFGLTKEEALEKAKESLLLVGLSKEFHERSPMTLSGGQMRKVAIAGVLAYSPDILILDEPTVGLDSKSSKQIMNTIENIHNTTNKTIIIVSHNMDLVSRYASRVIVLDSGKIAYDGTKYDLFVNNDLIKNLSLDLPNIIKLSNVLKENLDINLTNRIMTTKDLIKELEEYYETNNR